MRSCAAVAAALRLPVSDAHICYVSAACLSSSSHRSHCILQRQQLEELHQRLFCLRLLPLRARSTAALFTDTSASMLQTRPTCIVVVEPFHQLDSIVFNLLFVLIALCILEQQWPTATRCRSERCWIVHLHIADRSSRVICFVVFTAHQVLVLVPTTISSCMLCLSFSFLSVSPQLVLRGLLPLP